MLCVGATSKRKVVLLGVEKVAFHCSALNTEPTVVVVVVVRSGSKVHESKAVFETCWKPRVFSLPVHLFLPHRCRQRATAVLDR